MDIKSNTNIRYYIYKELNRYLTETNKYKSEDLNPFVLPIFSGIISTLIASWISDGHTEVRYKVYTICAIIILFPLLYSGTKIFLKYCRKFCNACRKQNKSKDTLTKEEGSRSAKVNYEVSYLVYLASSYILEETKNESLKKYNQAEAIFHLVTALRKLNEALFITGERISEYKLPNNRIISIMEMISYLIGQIGYNSQDVSVMSAITSYNGIVKTLKIIYKIELSQISSLPLTKE